MADRVRIGVEFEVPPDSELHDRGHVTVYRDTIWLTEQEYGQAFTTAALTRIKAGTDPKVNAMKGERHANWKAVVLTPSEEPVPAEGG